MKKLLLSLVAVLVLTGCTSKVTSIDSKEELFSIGTYSVNEADLYQVLKSADKGLSVIRHSQNILTSTIDDASVMEEAKAELEKQKTALGKDFESTIAQFGYKDEADFFNRAILPELKMATLINNDIKENYDTLFARHKPVKAAILELKDAEAGEAALKRLEAGEKLSDIAKDNTTPGSNLNGEVQIHFTSNANYPTSVTQFLQSAVDPADSKLLDDLKSGKKYLVSVENAKIVEEKEVVLEAAKTYALIQDETIAKKFRENNFTVYDKEIYDALQERFSKYFK